MCVCLARLNGLVTALKSHDNSAHESDEARRSESWRISETENRLFHLTRRMKYSQEL